MSASQKRQEFLFIFYHFSRLAPFYVKSEWTKKNNHGEQSVYGSNETKLIVAGSGDKFIFRQLKLMDAYSFNRILNRSPLTLSVHNINSSAEIIRAPRNPWERKFVRILINETHQSG